MTVSVVHQEQPRADDLVLSIGPDAEYQACRSSTDLVPRQIAKARGWGERMHRILIRIDMYSSTHKVEAEICATMCSIFPVSPSAAKKSFIVLDLNSDSLNCCSGMEGILVNMGLRAKWF